MIGLIVSQRNMGLMLAATDGVLPGLTLFYFALCQFPIYLSRNIIYCSGRYAITRQSDRRS